jgi:S1-C subfamily serine protease
MEQATTNTSVLGAFSTQMADAVERVSAAIVQVNGRPRQAATGVVYAQDLVLTADHVVEVEENLTVGTHDGRTLPAQVAGRDPSSDLAVLRVAGLNIEPASPAEAAARVGQFVLAIGRPSSDGIMASSGIVSAVGGPLRMGRHARLEQFIRTDAIPYPGFSGGPLVDAQGGVLGILTTGLAGGAALAIPSSVAWRTAETLTKQGSIKRGYLGISSQPVQLAESQRAGWSSELGLLIIRVEPGSPADKGGLLIGDILVGLDGQALNDTDDLQSLLSGDRVGKPVPVQVIRGGALQTLQITIGERS